MKRSNSSEKYSNQSSRRDFLKKASIGGLSAGLLGTDYSARIGEEPVPAKSEAVPPARIKITDLRCAVLGSNPVIRITTDAGIDGYGEAERSKSYLKPFVLFYKDYLIGEDPTNVERIMLKIRRMGSFKPWGAAVSSIEWALWDIAGKAAGLPVYKLLGGKIRDRVRAYGRTGGPEGFTITKRGIAFHGGQVTQQVPNFYLGNTSPSVSPKNVAHPYRGPLTEKGLKYLINQVEGMRKELGDDIGLALDCGPGFMLSDAIRFARAMEPFNLMWIEDVLTGDYDPYVLADDYRELTMSTTTPVHTGEQIYLRQHFRELIEKHAVRVLGPDPADMGGIAEMKWVAEYADLHSIMFAPHGTGDGLIGIAAQVQAGAAMPENYIAFEYSFASPEWWYDIIDGLPDPIVKDGQIEVWDRPGLGVEFNVKAASKYLAEEDKDFFS